MKESLPGGLIGYGNFDLSMIDRARYPTPQEAADYGRRCRDPFRPRAAWPTAVWR